MSYAGPGLYKHYRGGLYTVLFCAEEVVADGQADEGPLSVYVYPDTGAIHVTRGEMEKGGVLLFVAEDSTNGKRHDFSDWVLYVSLTHKGLRARKRSEFDETVTLGSSVVPRFSAVQLVKP